MRVKVVAHDPAWSAQAEQEAKRLQNGLGDIIVAIHHIGSTAIPGIYAKPIIDFLMEVDELEHIDQRIPDMENLGYESMGEYGIPERRYFRKNNAQGIRIYQVHTFKVGSDTGKRHIAFRDYLIAHPEEAQEYSVLKRAQAAAHPDDIQAYMDGKDPFIKHHEAKAIEWCHRDV
jgi:GrpB-like predicted nucleotidyltransferase (UPF0157 family)